MSPSQISGVNAIENGVLLSKHLHSMLARGAVTFIKVRGFGNPYLTSTLCPLSSTIDTGRISNGACDGNPNMSFSSAVTESNYIKVDRQILVSYKAIWVEKMRSGYV
jgi:hypothetical protein